MESEGNECLLDLIELIAHLGYFFCPLIGRPLDPLFTQLTSRSERQHRVDHRLFSILLDIGGALSPVIDRRAQIHQMTVQVGVGDRRSQITNQGRRGATFRDQTLGGVIGRV